MDLLKNPEVFTSKIREQLDAERESLREPGKAAETYAKRLVELERRKDGYWDLAASGDMPKDVMRSKIAALDKEAAEIRASLDELQDAQTRLKELDDIDNLGADLLDDLGIEEGVEIRDDYPEEVYSAMYVVHPSGAHLAWEGGDDDRYAALLNKLRLEVVKHKDERLVIKGERCQKTPTGCRRA